MIKNKNIKEWAHIKKICGHKIAMEAVHQSYIDNPPIRNGKRLMGSAIRGCFWEGFDGTKIRIIDNTPCHSAWKAGRYHRRKINKDGSHWKQFENHPNKKLCLLHRIAGKGFKMLNKLDFKSLDSGTQFKIFDRVSASMKNINPEKKGMESLALAIYEETNIALAENAGRCEECDAEAETMEWQEFDKTFICPDCGHVQ